MQKSTLTRRGFVLTGASVAASFAAACAADKQQEKTEASTTTEEAGTTEATDASDTTSANTDISAIIDAMSLDDKVSQLIMPAIRTWEGDAGVHDLSEVPGLAEALRRHRYGGIILFGSNIEDTEETARLTHDLQQNNAEAAGGNAVGYFIAADQEGGIVARISMGTRGTGSMAIGATGTDAEESAYTTGRIFGEELSSLGINLNLGPCLDIIRDLTDPGLSTRVFSDDPETVSELGLAFAHGVSESGVATCFKHFPGAGDGSDYPTAIRLTTEELESQGLIPYRAATDHAADMVMVSATTFPAFDDEHVLADGVTTGFYPASMSEKIVGEMLRGELGYDGVVMTDALEMDQFFEEPDTGAALLAGDRQSVEGTVNVAMSCLCAGCDILLLPIDLNSAERAGFYDDYVAALVARIEDGTIDITRVDESLRRILTLKEHYGILTTETEEAYQERLARALEVVGSKEHHDRERSIAEKAVTLIKNDHVLPIDAHGKHVVIVGRTVFDDNPITYALKELKERGLIDNDTCITDLITGETTGSPDSTTHITISYYYAYETGTTAWSDELSAAIVDADVVVCLSNMPAGIDALQTSDARVQGISRTLEEAHAADIPFILLSDGIPTDAARYTGADGVVCCYLSAGFDVDPTTGSGSEHMRAINACVPAALRAIFGASDMPGSLPIAITSMQESEDGTWNFTDEVLYPHGTGAVS